MNIAAILKYCLSLISSVCENAFIKAIGTALLIAYKFLFDVTQTVPMGSIVVLVIFDSITGMAAAFKTGEPIESRKALRTVIKLVVYSIFISAAYLTGTNLVAFPMLEQIVMGFIALTELISIMENIGKMGYAIPQKLLNQLESLRDEK